MSRRPKLTALGRTAPAPPPTHLCSCGCGREASIGHPFGRWYVPGHEPAAAPAIEAPPAPADLFGAAGVSAPTRYRARDRRLTT